MRWVAFGIGVVLLWAGVALAEESEPLALRYDAAAECPDSRVFFGQIAARTTRVRAPKDGETARALHVRLARAAAGTGFIGHLHFEDGSKSTSPRVVEGASCAEVAEALGLVAALAVDPAASTAPVASLPAADAGAVDADGGSSGVTGSNGGAPAGGTDAHAPADGGLPRATGPNGAGAGAGVSSSSRDASAGRDAHPRAPSPHDRVQNTRFGAGVAVEAAGLGAFVPSGRVFLEVVLRDRAEVLAPSIRVFGARSLDVERSRSVGSAVGAATLTWTYAGVDVCPVRVGLGGRLTLRPCAEVNAGVLAADSSGSSGVEQPADRRRAWVAADLHGRLAWEPVRFLALELEGGALVPFVRETFLFLPRADVYQAPIIAVFGRAGASVRFP